MVSNSNSSLSWMLTPRRRVTSLFPSSSVRLTPTPTAPDDKFFFFSYSVADSILYKFGSFVSRIYQHINYRQIMDDGLFHILFFWNLWQTEKNLLRYSLYAL